MHTTIFYKKTSADYSDVCLEIYKHNYLLERSLSLSLSLYISLSISQLSKLSNPSL